MIGRATLSPRVQKLAAMAAGLDPDPEHALQVTWLASRLFDEFGPEHGLGPEERELLLAGAVAHDVGWGISGTRHHKHSARLIEEMDLPEFTERERAVIVALARYHRGAMPKGKHRVFKALSEPDRETVRTLAAILRIADGLDRSHGNVVRNVTVQRSPEGLRILAHALEDPADELWAARKKADLFQAVFGPVIIEAVQA